MNSVLAILIQILGNCHIQDVNYSIALALYENFNSVPNLSTTQLADLCKVSVPRLNKFCKSIGYSDISTLKRNCEKTRDLLLHQTTYRFLSFDMEKVGKSLYSLSTASTPEEFMQKETLDSIVQQIEKSKRIIIFGSCEIADLFSAFQSFFAVFNKPVLISTVNRIDNLLPVKNGDLCIACTITGRLLKMQPDLFSFISKQQNTLIISSLPFPEFKSLKIYSQSEIFESYYFISFYLDCIKKLYWDRLSGYAD